MNYKFELKYRCKAAIYTLLAIFTVIDLIAQDLPPKQAYPLTVRQIHSGHSLTDPLFGQPWPGQYVYLITLLRGSWAGDDIGKSTIPGSPMHWRWNNSSGYPDARHNIDEFELLSITETAGLCYEGGSDQQWYLDCIREQREWLSVWTNHAWNNGNNGSGAATLLYTNWINIDGSDGPFRSMLDVLNGEWERMQDYANANRPSGAPHVYMIPGNRMMARLYDDVQAGLVPGITQFSGFFEDNIHVNSLGAYAIAMLHYACIFNQNPLGLPNQLIDNPPPGFQIPSVALATYIQNMVWDVVTKYPRTGIYPDNDNSVTASFTASPTEGRAPLTVAFDASASQNNGSGQISYRWNFGDGTAEVAGITVSHTYENPGIYTARLTVTNDSGSSDFATLQITVRSEDRENFCLTTITNLKQANCNGTGGHIRINVEPSVNYTLQFNGNNITTTANHEYTNLDAGEYRLKTLGPDNCTEEFQLHIHIDSSTCPGWKPAECSMLFGTNLNGFADWEPHRPLKNYLKNTRGEPIPYSDDCNCWSFENWQQVLDEMDFDEDGYPIGIPQSTSAGLVKLRYFCSASGLNMPPDRTYVLLYEGQGLITLHGSINNEIRNSGRIQFDLGGDGTFWFQIEASTASDHIRNIRILNIAHESADLNTDPFYEGFLSKIQPFQLLRFMDWMHTNNSPLEKWEDRRKPGYFSYGGNKGVPYEIIIQLANQTKQDIWICVPHAADDDFIRNMALIFKENLDPDITIFLEYSNEVWNWIFEQAHYNLENNPDDLIYGRAYAEKARNTFAIWHDIFAEDACRVKRVLGIQGGFNFLNEHTLAHLRQDEWDFGSPTHYFGLDHEDTGNPRLDILGSSATVDDIMKNALNDFHVFSQYVKQDYRNIQLFGKEVITYEGGQHFVGNVFGNPYDYQQAMWDAQNSEAMYQAYQLVFDSIKTWGCKLATNFSLAGPQENIYGSWGMLDDIDVVGPYRVTAPKYQVHLDNIPSIECASAVRKQWSSCSEDPSQVKNPTTSFTNELKVYPNPGSELIYILNQHENYPIDIYDMLGKKVLSTKENMINTIDMASGIYLIVNGYQTLKWMKI